MEVLNVVLYRVTYSVLTEVDWEKLECRIWCVV